MKEEIRDKEDILVSVSCITYNHGKYLREALEGFLMQDCDFKYEILIHDDASTDDTPDIIREYEKKYPNIIKPILQRENQYSRGIRNISGVFNFPRASGKYIAMCEGDDFWTDPEKLKLQAEYMERHRECAMTLHSARILHSDGAYHASSMIRPYEGDRPVSTEEVISKKSNYPTASLMIRTEYAKELPEYYFKCPVGDIPLQIYMASRGTVYYFDRPMSVYRQGAEGSWSSDIDSGESKKKWEEHYKSMKELYRDFDRETGGKFLTSVKEALGRERFLIDLKEGRLKALKEKKNRKFRDELLPMERRLLLLKLYCPFMWGFLRKARLFFMNRS
ncbi:MAG: glycosyltransferase [Candidatus Avilachnospira sp.]|jgi:glycosyltransferase involved in cell wall biosynthesis